MIPDYGKYALFVWTCYGLSLGTILALTFATLRMNAKRRHLSQSQDKAAK